MTSKVQNGSIGPGKAGAGVPVAGRPMHTAVSKQATFVFAFKATGCSKEYSRMDGSKRPKIKEQKTGGDTTMKHIGDQAGHGRRRAAGKLLAKSVEASMERAKGSKECKGSRQARRKKAMKKLGTMRTEESEA